MIQDSEDFKKLYKEVYCGGASLSPVKIYYSTDRDLQVYISRGKAGRFFRSARECIAWASREGWIPESMVSDILEEVTATAEQLERREWALIEQADKIRTRNQAINDASGDLGAVARILCRGRRSWKW